MHKTVAEQTAAANVLNTIMYIIYRGVFKHNGQFKQLMKAKFCTEIYLY